YALTPRPYRNISAKGFSYLIGARIETTTRPIMISPVTKTDHNSALGCSSPSMRRGIMLAAIIAAFATCGLSFAPAVFAQSDPLGESARLHSVTGVPSLPMCFDNCISTEVSPAFQSSVATGAPLVARKDRGE